MTITTLAPAFIQPQQLDDALKFQDYGVLNPVGVATFTRQPLSALELLKADWDDLSQDNFLKDGGS